MTKFAGFLVVMCWLVSMTHVPRVSGSVTLVNNGYEGVVVYIASAVKEDATLIENIKSVLSDASDWLFDATRNRAFFRNVSIVIPKSWTSIAVDSTIPAVNKFDGYIRIDAPGDHGHQPYVRGNLECGKSAWFMHLTPEFINGDHVAVYGARDRSVIHEWGHLRWGLFDEYPSIMTTFTAPNRINFSNGGGKWNPVTCSKQITGNAYQGNCDVTKPCGLDNLTLDPSCKFCPDTAQTATASIMGSQWIESVTGFCDKDADSTPASSRHDSTAPNLQNKMCNYQSSWEVMLAHEDFSGGNNPSISLGSKESPTFNIVQERPKVRVFVYDVSGSMQTNSKITKQADSSYVVIDNVVETGSYLGLVSFNSSARTLADLTEVTSGDVRDSLKQAVPRYADGGTQIYNGLLKAIQVIESSPYPSAGAEIVLLSDGESNDPYSHITDMLIERGIVVHSIAITNAADPLMAQLASDTGGNSFTYLETDSVTFADVFIQATASDSASASAAIEILGTTYTLTSSSPVSGVFNIDDGLGTDTTLTVIQSTGYEISVSLLAPNGTSYSTNGSDNVLSLKLAGISLTGQYSFSISTQVPSIYPLEVMVSSKQNSDDVDTIQVTSYLNSSSLDFNSPYQVRLIASVFKGSSRVLNANVTAVLAADSSFTPLSLRLLDTGTGADSIYGDGIYSTYLLRSYFTANSGYNIKVYVEGHGEAYTQGLGTNGADSIPGTIDGTSITTTDVGSFSRQSIPGEITVNNYVSNPVDTTPPSQVTDLLVADIFQVVVNGVASMTYTLTWSAVGSDMDIGQAEEYDMRFNSDIHLLRSNFTQSSQVPALLPVPQSSGVTESVNITFDSSHCVGICYLAIKAIDENGLIGDTSNIINIDIDFSYVVIDRIPDIDNNTSVSINLVLILSLLAVFIVFVVLCAMAYHFLHDKTAGQMPVKISPRVDLISAIERDECEKLREQYYNDKSGDAVIPFRNSDIDNEPSFSASIKLKEFDGRTRGETWFDDETISLHKNDLNPETEKVQMEMFIHRETEKYIEDYSTESATKEVHADFLNLQCKPKALNIFTIHPSDESKQLRAQYYDKNTQDAVVPFNDSDSDSWLDDETNEAIDKDNILPGADNILPGADTILPGADNILPGADNILPGADNILPGADNILPGADTNALNNLKLHTKEELDQEDDTTKNERRESDTPNVTEM